MIRLTMNGPTARITASQRPNRDNGGDWRLAADGGAVVSQARVGCSMTGAARCGQMSIGGGIGLAALNDLRHERDDFSSNNHPALLLCLSMIFVRKPVPTFRDHALVNPIS